MSEEINYSVASQSDIRKARLLYKLAFGIMWSEEDWERKYFHNPFGSPVSYGAYYNAELISFYSYHPALLLLHGEEKILYQDADAMTHPAFRRRGLYRHIKQLADDHLIAMGIPFAISFPNEANLLATKEFGAVFVGKLTRWVRTVSTRGLGGVEKWKAALGMFYASLFRASKTSDSVELVQIYDERFDFVWNLVKPQFQIAGIHNRTFLKWRYEGRKNTCAWVSHNPEPDGLVIAEKYSDYMCIHDLLIQKTNLNSFKKLVTTLVAFCLENNLNRISFPILGSVYNHLLRCSGFMPLAGRSPFRLNQLSFSPQQWEDKRLWYISNADRDWQ